MPNFASKACRSVADSAAAPVRMKRSAPGRKVGNPAWGAGNDVSSNIVTIVGTMLAQVTWYASIQGQKWLRLNLRAMTIVLPAIMEAQRPTTGPFTWKKGRAVKPRSVGESR